MSATDVLELARSLLEFDTVNPPGQEEACAHFVGDLLGQAGFDVSYQRVAPGRSSVVARIGRPELGLPICFTGHLDTVPLGSVPWSRSPFAGEVINGRLYGRGASDMKGGVAAICACAIEVAPQLQRTRGAVLVFTAAEETGCEGAKQLAVAGALGKAGAIVVAEPTENEPVLGHKGALWLAAGARGKTAHGSMPERGDNAIYKLAAPLLRLREFTVGDAVHPMMGRSTVNVGTFRAGRNVNSVPDEATAEIDVRVVPGDEPDAIYARLCGCLGDGVSLRRLLEVDGVLADPSDAWVQRVYAIAQPFHPKPLADRTVPFFSDGAVLSRAYGGVPALILGPGESAMAHQTDEYCLVERLYQAQQIYTRLMKDWCGIA